MRVSKVAIINLALVLCFLAIVEGGDVSSIITPSLFHEMLKHRNDDRCEAKGFYTYKAFITAANYFSEFGTAGDINLRKRELAAFFAQTSHETTGGWASAPDGPYAWGYCKKKEEGVQGKNFCHPDANWPCVPGRKYYGRGPMQITYNYNYGPAGRAIHEDLLSHPGLVDTDPVISFKTAIWFWMTPQEPKPSCHDVITNKWRPSPADRAAGRAPGFGVITNIINGGVECGKGTSTDAAKDRVGFYKRYCGMLGVDPGPNLPCRDQKPFG